MKEGKNIGGYDKNAFYDRKAVNYLEGFLLETDYVMPHISSEDKTPNLDGYFEILVDNEKKKIPSEKFEVQVKSLNHDYINKNVRENVHYAYKYSCDTKAMNIVLEGMTQNPVLLILVDTDHKHIFWKYLSMEYCLELNIDENERKTIYFDFKDEITDVLSWIKQLREIYHEKYKLMKSEKDNDFILPENCKKIPIEVQECFDYLNNLMQGELWFVKECFFKDTWKFGIAYYCAEQGGMSCVGIYKILKGENDLFIRAFSEKDRAYFITVHFTNGYRTIDIIKDMIKDWVQQFFEKDVYFTSIMPDRVLMERVFHEIDEKLSIKAMNNRKSNQKKIVLGLPVDVLNREELGNILIGNKWTGGFASCLNELLKRGYFTFVKPWKELVDFHVESEHGGCVHYKEDEDRKKVDIDNMRKFISGFAEFYFETSKQYGHKSERVFNLKNCFKLYVSNDCEHVVFFEEISNKFGMECTFVEDENKLDVWELKKNQQEPFVAITRSLISRQDYSWYKLWRIMCRTLFLKYIDREEDIDIMTEYRRG